MSTKISEIQSQETIMRLLTDLNMWDIMEEEGNVLHYDLVETIIHKKADKLFLTTRELSEFRENVKKTLANGMPAMLPNAKKALDMREDFLVRCWDNDSDKLALLYELYIIVEPYDGIDLEA